MNRSIRRGASLIPLVAAGVVVLAALALLATSSGSGSSDEDILAKIGEQPANTGPVVDPRSIQNQPAGTQETPATTRTVQNVTPSVSPSETPRTSSGDGLDDSRTLPYSNAKQAPAPLQFELPYLDMGVIEPGSYHVSTVEVENISDDRLTVRNIYTGCKCTTAYFENNQLSIAPGERLNLVIETEAGFNLTPKAVSVSIAVREYTSAARFTTKFSVNNIVAATPSFVNNKDRTWGRVQFTALDGRPFRVLTVNGEPPVYYLNEGEEAPGPDEARTYIAIRWDYEGITMPPRIMVIETDHPQTPIIGLPVYNKAWDIETRNQERGNIIGDQRRYNLGYVKPGESQEITVKFSNMSSDDRKRGVFYDSVHFTAEHLETRPGENDTTTYETFRITASEDLPEGMFQTPMTFEVGTSATWLWCYGIGRHDGM